MAAVTVALPGLLAGLIGGRRRVPVDADDLAQALAELCARHPELRVHVFADDGRMRPHVLCLHNGETERDLDRRLADGDEVTVMQAVSGG